MPLLFIQVVYAACLAIAAILVLYVVYYRVYKAHLIKTHPDKILLEEIRRQRQRREYYEQGKFG